MIEYTKPNNKLNFIKREKKLDYKFHPSNKDIGICYIPGEFVYFIDKNKQRLFSDNYEDAGFFIKNIAWVRKYNKEYYINEKGEKLFNQDFEFCTSFNEKFNVARVIENGNYYLINQKGEKVKNISYEYMHIITKEGYILVKKDGKEFYIDINCNEVFNKKYDFMQGFNQGICLVKENGKFHHINENGERLYPQNFDEIVKYDDHNVLSGIIDGKPLFITLDGTEVNFKEYKNINNSKELDVENLYLIYYENDVHVRFRGYIGSVEDFLNKESITSSCYEYIDLYTEIFKKEKLI